MLKELIDDDSESSNLFTGVFMLHLNSQFFAYTVESVVGNVMSIHAGVSSMLEMEVSPDDSQSPFQGQLSPAAPEQHPQTHSPDVICSTLQILSPPPINSPNLHLFLFLIRPHHRLLEYLP
ncbi:hypothetical protein CDAR_210061 [Caerostris darwini]|uniref:Uncharacterized protein n=1 Tax=Caerostris darwini TaxID=1538125 RepID=A0AAV4S8V6_9ARAC|nr:hypothetical protein CDAR_210061 [Caerostris darwini]